MTSSKNTEGEGLLQADLAVLANEIAGKRATADMWTYNHPAKAVALNYADALQRIHDRLSSAALPSKHVLGDGSCLDPWSEGYREGYRDALPSVPADAVKPAVAGEGGLREAVQQACDLLAERTHGSPARSPGHNARLCLEAALSTSVPAGVVGIKPLEWLPHHAAGRPNCPLEYADTGLSTTYFASGVGWWSPLEHVHPCADLDAAKAAAQADFERRVLACLTGGPSK